MAHVPSTEVTIKRCLGIGHAIRSQCVLDCAKELIKTGAITHGHVVDLVSRSVIRDSSRQQVCLYRVVYKAKIATGFAVTIDMEIIALDHRGSPFRDNGSISAIGILAFAENVEVTQPDSVETIAARKDIGVQLVHVFSDSVGRQGLADSVFYLGQAGVITIGGTAGSVDEATHLGVTRGDEHVEKPVYVGGVAGERIGEASGHTPQSSLVQYMIDSGTGTSTVVHLANVTLDKAKAGPLCLSHEATHFVQVSLVAGSKIIEPHDTLVELKQGFKQVRTDEASYASDKPRAGLLAQFCLDFFVASHFSLLQLCFFIRIAIYISLVTIAIALSIGVQIVEHKAFNLNTCMIKPFNGLL